MSSAWPLAALGALCACGSSAGRGTATTAASAGTTSATSSSSSGGSGTGGGSSGGVTWTQVTDEGGGVVAAPTLVFLTYGGDGNEAALQQWGSWIADGGYLPLVAGQYGIGNASIVLISLGSTTPPPTWGSPADQNVFAHYLAGLMGTQAIPAATPSTLYVLELPHSWPDAAAYCKSEGSFHGAYQDPLQGQILYAVIPACASSSLTEIEVATSHEIVEAATDPGAASWQIQDPDNPWTYLGGEVADLCASVAAPYQSGPWAAQLIWSNSAAARGEVPCQPWPSGQAYLALLAPPTLASAPAGGVAQIEVAGWSSAATAPWNLIAIDGDYAVDFSTTPALSAPAISAGGTVAVTLHVPATATSGQHGAAWIVCVDPRTAATVGSAMVGVTVE